MASLRRLQRDRVGAAVHEVPEEHVAHGEDVPAALVRPGEGVEELQQVRELPVDVPVDARRQRDLGASGAARYALASMRAFL